MTQRKAVALVSGGLDSMLAVRLIQEQGIYVEGLNFFTGFCVEGHTQAVRTRHRAKPKRNNALWVAEQLGIRLHFVDVVEPYQKIVLNPKHGYGAHLNPCLDCKIFMVQQAFQWMKAHDFDFIITGEVVGQRPKSQRKDTLPVVARESGAEDLLLRPLSALHLPPTRPEREGWVDRSRLLGLSGRNRKPQIALAQQFGFEDFSQPAGGCCFLTDPNYSRKLQDLWDHRQDRRYTLEDLILLKIGRHLRPGPTFKVIIAREEGEGRFLQGYRKRYVSLRTLSHSGPEALLEGEVDEAALQTAARLVARYSKGRTAPQVIVEIETPQGDRREMPVVPFQPREIPSTWML